MALYMKCPPFCSSTEGLGWGGSFFFFLIIYFRLLETSPMLCYPNSSTGGVFCVPGSVSLEQNNPELVLCHGIEHRNTCMEFPAERKTPTPTFLWIFQGLLQSPGVLTRPWKCCKSGNLIMENTKEGRNGFGRDLQEEALKIFTQ